MKRIILLLLFLPQVLLAQKFTLRGMVLDSAAKPLNMATVMLMSVKDSSLQNFARSTENGSFEIKNIPNAPYYLRVTFVGLAEFQQLLPSSITTPEHDMGKIQLFAQSKELSEVVVKGDKAPVTIKQDTIEYNAGSFKTQPNAVVEDLLKKLPGVQVEKDGTVKAQGETVRRVLVDGKDFFGGRDTKIATKNLPADAIDKVQILDRKSDQAVFSGVDDGQKEKAMNLTLKEDKKNGIFGYATAGAGNIERFSSKLALNRFTKNKQFSVLGLGNNTNEQGFSIQDYLNYSGDMQRMMSGGGGMLRLNFNSEDMPIPLDIGGRNNGFIKSWAGGLNFNEQLNKKTEINGSYLYSGINRLIGKEVNTQTILPNRTIDQDQQVNQNSQNDNHRLNVTLDQKIDSSNSVKLTTSFVYNKSQMTSQTQSQTYAAPNVLQNSGDRTYNTGGDDVKLDANLLFRHRFEKKGRNASLNLLYALNNQNKAGNLNATNRYFYKDSTVTQPINQRDTQLNNGNNYGLTFSIVEPIAKRRYLELNYSYRKNVFDNTREVFDVVSQGERLNTNLTNRFNSDFSYNKLGLNFRINEKKYNVGVGVAVQEANLEGKITSKNWSISRSFFNVLPNLRFKFNFSQTTNLSMDYETSMQEPNIQQLQPVINNTDPLNISLGNPDLKPEYTQRLNLNYLSYNASNFASFFANMSINYTQDNISNAQTIDANLVRTFKPINVAENLTVSTNLNYGWQLKAINSRLNLSGGFTHNQGINLLNEAQNRSRQWIYFGDVRFEYTLKEKLNASFSVNMQDNATSYSLDPRQNQHFLNQTYTIETSYKLPANFRFGTELNYYVYSGQTTTFNQSYPIWNMNLSKFFLKKQRGELKFSVTDMLNQNVGINRMASGSYVLEERIRSLGRFFLLSFTYNINGTGGGPKGVQMKIIQR